MVYYFFSIFIIVVFFSSLIIATEKDDVSWVVKYLKSREYNKERTFDYETTSDFIFNSRSTSIFSPICSEINILIQACNGEYGNENKNKAFYYLNSINKLCDLLDVKISNLENFIYIPESFTGILDERLSDCAKIFYEPNDSKRVLLHHYSLMNSKLNLPLNSSINEHDFKKRNRIYTSLINFEDSWEKPFQNYEKLSFWYNNFEIKKRRFLINRDHYKYEIVKISNDQSFIVIAFPYYSISETLRYMIYIFPINITDELDITWQNFYQITNGNIYNYIKNMEDTELTLIVPKIEKLKHAIKLNDVLKKTYGNNLPKNIILELTTLIKFNDKRKKVSFETEVNSKRPILNERLVLINKPYISLVYDMSLKRVLYVIKDTGIIEE